MEVREVDRNPDPPILNEVLIDLLSSLCFRKNNDLDTCELLFVFSSAIELDTIANKVRDVLDRGLTKKVFITGGIATYQNTKLPPKTECELFFDHLDTKLYSDVTFYTEKESRNTLENLTKALQVYDFSELERVMFIFKAHAAGRGYLTLKKFLPKAHLVQNSFDCYYSDAQEPLSRENWFLSDFGRRRVWGEFLRIKLYGERGDIEFEEVRDLVQEIEATIAQ